MDDEISIDGMNSSGNVKYHLKQIDRIDHTDPSSLNILYANTQSLRNKLYDVELVIKSLQCDVQVLVLTETWLTEEENKFFNIPGYQAFHSNRPRGYGGTAIYVKSVIAASNLYSIYNDYYNLLVVKLMEFNINIVSVYRSQKNNLTTLFTQLENTLSTYSKSIVIGDLNINLLDSCDTDVITYKEIINSYGYCILNKIDEKYATRVSNGVKTIIDHIVTDIFNFKYEMSVTDTTISDHKLIMLRVKNQKIIRPKSTQKTVLDYKYILSDPFWGNIHAVETFETLNLELKNIIQKNTKIIPQKRHRKFNNEWMTDEICQLTRMREKFFRLKKRCPENIYIIERHKYYSSMVSNKVQNAQKLSNKSNIESNIQDSKKMWNHLKNIIFNKSNNSEPETFLQIGNNLICDPQQVANKFNSFFVSITSEITNHLRLPSYLDFDYINYNIQQPFTLDPVNNIEIRSIITELKSNAATGADGISSKFLKHVSQNLCSCLVMLINKLMQEGSFPENLKKARVVPVFKSGNRLELNNYRPISVLSAVSKIVEKVILKRFEAFLSANNIISKYQYGFCPKSNTATACVNLTNFLSVNIDKKKYVSCIFLDIRKAFDSVRHEILIYKLRKLGMTECQLNLFVNYLSNRTQEVSINDKSSNEQSLFSGVPQGSILGPCLFRFYINDLSLLELNGVLQLFADDGVMMYESDSLEDLFLHMQEDLNILHQWMNKNFLILNSEKTKFILFENKILDPDLMRQLKITYENTEIERVKYFKYLGLTIDDKLKWNYHIDKIKSSIVPYIFAINRTKRILPKETLLLIYDAYIMSRFVHLNPIWSGCARFKILELIILQKRALKFILQVPILYPTSLLFEKFISLDIVIDRELLILIYKIVNNLIKHNFVLIRVADSHNHNTRRQSYFRINFFSTNASNNNVLYRGLNKFNSLPQGIKHEENIVTFKKKVTNYLTNGQSLGA